MAENAHSRLFIMCKNTMIKYPADVPRYRSLCSAMRQKIRIWIWSASLSKGCFKGFEGASSACNSPPRPSNPCFETRLYSQRLVEMMRACLLTWWKWKTERISTSWRANNISSTGRQPKIPRLAAGKLSKADRRDAWTSCISCGRERITTRSKSH